MKYPKGNDDTYDMLSTGREQSQPEAQSLPRTGRWSSSCPNMEEIDFSELEDRVAAYLRDKDAE